MVNQLKFRNTPNLSQKKLISWFSENQSHVNFVFIYTYVAMWIIIKINMVIGIDEKCIVDPEISYFPTDRLKAVLKTSPKINILQVFESLGKSFSFVIWLTLQIFSFE